MSEPKRVLYKRCNTIRDAVEEANLIGLTTKDIINIVPFNSMFYLIYYK